jgi:long-subunit acyl-CoA synthetase (AMP-forming)
VLLYPALLSCCSYLPLAHIYERNNMTVAVHLGGSVGFYSGNVQELLDDVLVSGLVR